MQYKIENRTVLGVPKTLVIAAINPLVYYLIVKVSYAGLLLITKLIFIGIKFEVFGVTSCIYNGLAKLEKKIKPD